MTKAMENEQDIALWISQLIDAGWRQIRLNIWQSPSGEWYRGPYGAWQEMLRRRNKAYD